LTEIIFIFLYWTLFLVAAAAVLVTEWLMGGKGGGNWAEAVEEGAFNCSSSSCCIRKVGRVVMGEGEAKVFRFY
jgi:SNF family Na+-dependent transporter